ncbi:MAG: hypothetical protein LBT80_06190 [Lactobacillaceae bacterium]|jgi:hypothetical protein|nr:hypothetical protein [Lactobacillaceae bacterium]
MTMTTADKLQKIIAMQTELKAMYATGDFGELLRTDLAQEQVDFLLELKDYYRALEQQEIIAGAAQ